MFENPIMDIAAVCIALVVVWVAAFVVVLKLKKMVKIGANNSDSSDGMNMERIEQIHAAGMISDEEFAKMRRVLLGLPPIDGEKNKKVQPSGSTFDIMENLDKTDNTNGNDNV